MKKILFFTPYGGRTGSEMLLWNILQHLDTSRYQAMLYADRNGSLREALPPHIPYHTSPYNGGFLRRSLSRLQTAAGFAAYEGHILALHRQFKPDYWYLNTTAMAHLAPLANRLGIPVIAHVSEMPYLLFETVKRDDLVALLWAGLVLGLSENACAALRVMGVANPRLLPPSIDLRQISVAPARVAALRAELGIPPGAFVWGASGSLIYRKGIDYLPALARRMKAEGRDCYFLWMGGQTTNASEHYLRCLLTHEGHTNVMFTGALSDTYYDHMALIDAFLMLSHEETFGMVNVEAAYLGKPILSFDSGGIRDILLPGMGQIVESWNVADFADAMLALMDGKIVVDPAVSRQRAQDFAPALLYQKWDEYVSGYTL